MRFLKGWRTRIYSGVELLAGALVLIQPDNIQLLLSDDRSARWFGFALIAQGLVRYGFRQITTTPPGDKY